MADNIQTEGDSLVIYSDKRKMIRRLNMRGLFILLPVVIGMFVLFAFLRRLLVPPTPSLVHTVPPFIVTEFTYLPWCVLVFYFAVYVTMLAVLQRQNKPLLTISPEGLLIHTVATQIGLLRWEEIGEVRTYNFIYRFVGIVPRDPCRPVPAIRSVHCPDQHSPGISANVRRRTCLPDPGASATGAIASGSCRGFAPAPQNVR